MRRSLKPWLLGITLAVTPAVVFAQQPQPPKEYPACTTKPTEADVSGAKGAFQAGQASFNEGDYATAITYWEDAFHRDCTAVALLLNLGRAYELNGQKAAAVNALKAYIKRKPKSPQIDQIQKRIEVLEEKIAKEKQKPGGTAPSATTAGTSTATAAPSTTATGTGTPPPTAKSGGSRPILPLIVAGGGGAIGIAGLVGFLVENGKLQNLYATCPIKKGKHDCGTDAKNSAANSVLNTRNVWGGVGIAGGVIAVGGVVWYLLEPPRQNNTASDAPRRRTIVTPELGQGYAGLSVSGAF